MVTLPEKEEPVRFSTTKMIGNTELSSDIVHCPIHCVPVLIVGLSILYIIININCWLSR